MASWAENSEGAPSGEKVAKSQDGNEWEGEGRAAMREMTDQKCAQQTRKASGSKMTSNGKEDTSWPRGHHGG